MRWTLTSPLSNRRLPTSAEVVGQVREVLHRRCRKQGAAVHTTAINHELYRALSRLNVDPSFVFPRTIDDDDPQASFLRRVLQNVISSGIGRSPYSFVRVRLAARWRGYLLPLPPRILDAPTTRRPQRLLFTIRNLSETQKWVRHAAPGVDVAPLGMVYVMTSEAEDLPCRAIRYGHWLGLPESLGSDPWSRDDRASWLRVQIENAVRGDPTAVFTERRHIDIKERMAMDVHYRFASMGRMEVPSDLFIRPPGLWGGIRIGDAHTALQATDTSGATMPGQDPYDREVVAVIQNEARGRTCTVLYPRPQYRALIRWILDEARNHANELRIQRLEPGRSVVSLKQGWMGGPLLTLVAALSEPPKFDEQQIRGHVVPDAAIPFIQEGAKRCGLKT